MSSSRSEWKDFENWSNEIIARTLSIPPDQQIEFLRESIANADPRWKVGVTAIFFGTCESMGREQKQFERQREMRYFWSAIVGLLICLAVVIFTNLSRSGIYVLQLIGGLSAAALLAYMPGMLEVDLRLKERGSFWGGKIRGTSAGAAFIIVWLILPSLARKP